MSEDRCEAIRGFPDLEAELAQGEADLARRFAEGSAVQELLARRTALIDRVLIALWPEGIPAALVATGGYGRGELFPRSDVDLLVLVGEEPDEAFASHLAALKARLWDLGLRPGWAVRTPAQTIELARRDVSTATALFESRRIAGEEGLASALAAGLAEPTLWPPSEYFRAKIEERALRHRRFDDTAYNLEPNVKDGPGGLRDLQTLEWIAARVYGPGGLTTMHRMGELSHEEWSELRTARETLARIRYALHLLTSRAEERLLFDHQRELARRFGFRDEHAENLAVEQFMQGYYRSAHAVERLSELLIERFAERLEPPSPVSTERLTLDFRRSGNRITLADPRAFERPAALVELFRVLADQPTGVALSAATVRALGSALADAAPRLAEDSAALRAFLEILRRPGAVFRSLSAMHRHGVLGALLPAFAKVTGRMQYDLFHAYTVDQHTLFVLRELDDLFRPGRPGRRPLPEAVAAQIQRPELLYLGALFHDIAKGRGGDHSELGAEDAHAFARRLGLGAADAELVAWLVRAHLLMSRTAQREDIQDPKVIARFAASVGHRDRLDYLYLLTVADISATHPKLWNDWKGELLAALYDSTRLLIRRSGGLSLTAAERGAERRREALELLRDAGISPEQAERLWRDFPQDAFLRYEADQIAWQTRCLAEWDRSAGPLAAVRSPADRPVTEVFVVCPDMDGLFAALTATLDRLELDVLTARIATTTSGLAFDTFLVHERSGGAVGEGPRLREIAAALSRALSERPLRIVPARRVLPRRQRYFARPPRIEFAERDGRTEMLLICTDRPGLLAAVAAVFRDLGIRVHEARIATLGERAEDIFLLGGENDRPLSPTSRQALAERLAERLSLQWRESGGSEG
ncbi:MAG: bifunctional uridylyltransferase/uridylyl-removing enzyme [Lysobacterales bacterium]|nr:MAG: bifunctional uridylyltransferase/uridylyl-removing enzyme [Xanthomonadales bacterium]